MIHGKIIVAYSFINYYSDCLQEVGWDEDLNICDNLLQILNIDKFPQPFFMPSTEAATNYFYQQEVCCICYTLRLDDEDLLPTKMCNNTQCESQFHVTCLAQVIAYLDSACVVYTMNRFCI